MVYINKLFNLNDKVVAIIGGAGYLCREMARGFYRGIIAFRKPTLIKLAALKPTRIEKAEFIEQMRIIENGYSFYSVPVDYSTPSVNEPNDTIAILETLKNDRQQAALLKKILPN